MQQARCLGPGRVPVKPVAAGSAAGPGTWDVQEVAAASEAGMDARRE
ncbi:hypothetical protein [Desulfurivibrio dismutans]|nr:hypothetical protein [Desulfurivibrio alkaliphilus]MDF1613810.1 hypothetical protein [Desulfurivibrio alkaliphilus]